MKVFEAIKGRRSIRSYKDKKISKQFLKKIVEAAIWSPSGSNAQAWKFIVVDTDKEIKKIKTLSPGIFDLPVAVIVVCRDLKRAHDITGELGIKITSLMDISMASQNIMLMAYELGVGSCVVRSFGISAVKKLLELPDHINPELLITLGYPEKIPNLPKRRKNNEVIHWWKK